MSQVIVKWSDCNAESIQEAIEEFMEGQGQKLLEWEGRSTAEWLLSNYGRKPVSDAVSDKEVVRHLIECALYQHLDLHPNDYSFSIESLGK